MLKKTQIFVMAITAVLFANSSFAGNVGAVAFWGDNTYGQLNLPANNLDNLIAIGGGEMNSVFVRQDGTVVAAGNPGGSINPVPNGLSGVTSVAVGSYHALALKADGTVTAWGSAGSEQSSRPSSWSNITAIAAGYYVSLGLQTNGTLLAAGDNVYGVTNIPSQLTNVMAIAAGRYHCLAVTRAGTVVAWGNNSGGQTNVPVGLANVSAVTAGLLHSVALLSNGTVVAWGDNTLGQCNVPAGLTNVSAISAGLSHTLALRNDGTIVAWGDNSSGQANPLPDLFRAWAISAGGNHNLALSTSAPPFLISFPVDTNVPAGESVKFQVTAVGSAYSLTYQWMKDGTNLAGATQSTLLLNDVQAASAGAYTVFVGNTVGLTTNAAAMLNVLPAAPVITAQPATNRTLVLGAIAPSILSVQVKGSEPFSYQWRFAGNPIAGATQSSLGVTNFQSADVGVYDVVVSNAVGSITSDPATLSIQQPPGYVWVTKAASGFPNMIKGVAVDGSGNSYVAGSFSSSMGIGNEILTNTVGNYEIFLAKFGADGNLVWVTRAGGTSRDSANAVAVDAAGNVYVAGIFTGTALFGVTNSVGGSGIFVAKYDNAGNLIWVQKLGGNYPDEANGIAIDRDGNCLVTGSIGIKVGRQAFVAKYRADGLLLWQRVETSSNSSIGTAVTVDRERNVIITGNYAGYANFGSSNLVNNASSTNVFLAKYDSLGNLGWVLGAGGNDTDTASGVAADDNGNIYVTGNFQGEAFFGLSSVLDNYTNTVITPGGGGLKGDVFLAKYNSAGSLLWIRSGGSRLIDTAGCVAVDKTGNAYVSGWCANKALFGAVTTAGNQGAFDFTTMYDATGSLQWIARVPSSGCLPQSIASDDLGNVYTGGYFSQFAQFDNTGLQPIGTNFFLAKIKAFYDDLAPVITTQPVSQTVPAGGRLDLGLGLTSVGPVSYQWMFNGIDIPQGTNSGLVLTNLLLTAGGDYSVRLSNGFGAVTSVVANLNIEFSPDLRWAAQAGSDPGFANGRNLANAVATDVAGNVCMAGNFFGQIRFGTNVLFSYSGMTNSDAFLAKYDTVGTCLWARQMGGIGRDVATGVAMDQGGNIYVTGSFQRTANFGGILLTNTASNGSNQVFVAKYDSLGQLVWARQATGTNFSETSAIAADSLGNVYVTGGFSGTATFDNITLTATGVRNVFVAKWDTDGNLLWARCDGTTGNSTYGSGGLGIAIGKDGEVVVTGYYANTALFGTNVLGYLQNENFDNVFIAKYDPQGNNLWARAGYGNDSTFIQAIRGTGIAVDNKGNIFGVGYYHGKLAFGTAITLTNASSINVFLVKYDATGNPMWAKCVGNNGSYNYGTGIALDPYDNPVICGTLSPYARFDEVVTGNSSPGFGAKYSNQGKNLWIKTYPGSGFSSSGVGGVACSSSNAVVLVGSYSGSINFGVTNFSQTAGTGIIVTEYGIIPPSVLVQATNQAVILGSNATLRVTASGTGPLSYQWYLNGVAINGATNSVLTLINVHAANAGNYSVAVSNASGTVSSEASMTIVPVLDAPRLDAGKLVISWADGFALQISTNGVAGPYYDVPSASSPYTNVSEVPEQYFRLKN